MQRGRHSARRHRHKAEYIVARDLAKGRDVKCFGRVQGLALFEGGAGFEQIAVALAEGIVYFADDRAQTAVRPLAKPEADRVKYVTEHAGKGLQPDFPGRIMNPGLFQHAGDPGQRGQAAVAMVAVVETQQVKTIMRKPAIAPQALVGGQCAQGQP